MSAVVWQRNKVLTYTWVVKQLPDKPRTVQIKYDNDFYFYSIVYLLTGSQEQNYQIRKILCNYVVNEDNFMHLQSYIPCEYERRREYIDKMKLQGNTWGNEVMIFTTMQLTGSDVVTYINGWWELLWVSETFKKYLKDVLYQYNTENRYFEPIIGFLIQLF